MIIDFFLIIIFVIEFNKITECVCVHSLKCIYSVKLWDKISRLVILIISHSTFTWHDFIVHVNCSAHVKIQASLVYPPRHLQIYP